LFMMTWIFSLMIIFSVFLGAINGKIDAVSIAAINECTKAVELVISLGGVICLWSGLMKVATEAKLTDKIAGLLEPITSKLFKGISPKSDAAKAISMNMTANLLGLGNAATPLGIIAMKEMKKMSGNSAVATNNMITFVVLNTASIQIMPTTTALLRLQYGSENPFSILPAVWLSSVVSVTVAITTAYILSKFSKEKTGMRPVRNNGRG
ncbi:MAG: nucleoside recognition domain-containing protein, partial [Oscillospiraceae bacterium]